MKHTADLSEQQEQDLAKMLQYIKPIGQKYCEMLDTEYPETWSNKLTVPILMDTILQLDKKVQFLEPFEKKCKSLQDTVNQQRAELQNLGAKATKVGVDTNNEGAKAVEADATQTFWTRNMKLGTFILSFFLIVGILVGYIHTKTTEIAENEVKDTIVLTKAPEKLTFAQKAELIKKQADSAKLHLTKK